MKWCQVVNVPDIHVCTALDQKFPHLGVPKPRCIVERRVSLAFEVINSCIVVDEQLRHFKIMVYSDMKWCQVVNVPDIHVCTALDQKFRHLGVPKPRCIVERRLSPAVGVIYTCTVVDEQLRDVEISTVYSVMKWSRVANVPDIHIRAALK